MTTTRPAMTRDRLEELERIAATLKPGDLFLEAVEEIRRCHDVLRSVEERRLR